MENTEFQKPLSAYIAEFPLVARIARGEEAVYYNDKRLPTAKALALSPLTEADVRDASARLSRFAAYFQAAFPETRATAGILESPLRPIPRMKAALEQVYGTRIGGELYIKLDSHLAVSGSIKARGGIYEVLAFAEEVAMREGGLCETDDYAVLATEKYRQLFSRYAIAVGSTGNLGLSIGIISAALGFRVTVHMSSDARAWKKAMLREKGVTVVEYEEDYSVAVANGRRAAEGDPYCHFVDDENSRTLFLGYAVAAERLACQLCESGVTVDEAHPLYVYLPCGVGGGPGGVAFGLKLAFGDAVHPVFAEPTASPCMMLGMLTGAHNAVSVADFGLDNRTVADGLAVGRASGFVGRLMQPMIDGCYSITDARMSGHLALLAETEDIRLEPSALAGSFGPICFRPCDVPDGATHLVWATGGSMVPPEELAKYIEAGKAVALP